MHDYKQLAIYKKFAVYNYKWYLNEIGQAINTVSVISLNFTGMTEHSDHKCAGQVYNNMQQESQYHGKQ